MFFFSEKTAVLRLYTLNALWRWLLSRISLPNLCSCELNRQSHRLRYNNLWLSYRNMKKSYVLISLIDFEFIAFTRKYNNRKIVKAIYVRLKTKAVCRGSYIHNQFCIDSIVKFFCMLNVLVDAASLNCTCKKLLGFDYFPHVSSVARYYIYFFFSIFFFQM